ncbi:MAG: hypothetical protein J6L64_07075 [Opitutales bacterium]|nr:hypothetical protein [Opitutales bacterium]
MEKRKLTTTLSTLHSDVSEMKTDLREMRAEGKQRGEDIAEIKKTVAVHEEQISTNKRDIRDLKLLMWKILGICGGGAVIADKIFN